MAPHRRREFLQLMLAGVTATVSSHAFAQTHPAKVTTTPLNDYLHLISGAGANVLLVSSGDGLVLVNGGSSEQSNEVLKAVAAQSRGKRLTTLLNSDWCADHTGSNEAVGSISAEIIAHENTKQYLANDQFVEWQKRTYKAKPKVALPTKTFLTKGSLTAGSERIDYGHLGQAHTDGDIYVHLPTANVLMTGHAMTVGKYPIADYTTGGWLGGLLTATKTLLDLSNAQTRVIPATGPVQTRADLQAQFDMLTTLRERFAKMMRQGMSANDMLAAGATKEFDEKWGDPKLFVTVSYRGLWLHVRELGGIV
ncbi:MAG TPA: MBL fold metallo-hydrolase [Vicinamibacterales bacterium]|jgi:glyoxylase-like metal-dependent hydrolase (beta-lactamase superfamily II)